MLISVENTEAREFLLLRKTYLEEQISWLAYRQYQLDISDSELVQPLTELKGF